MNGALKRFHFNTIFWKIFLSYWLVMIIIIGVTFVAVALFADRDREQMERRFSLQSKAQALVTVYEHAGVEGAERWLKRRYQGRSDSIYLLDDKMTDLLGKLVSAQLKQALAAGDTVYIEHQRPRTIQKIIGQSDQFYWVAGLVPREHRHHGPGGKRLAPFFPFRTLSVFLTLLVTGLISYLLARHLTSPVRQLQVAAQGMAAGDLTTRVAGKVAARRDELGELAHDFNAMANEIERLVTAQKRMLRDVSHELRSPLARLQIALGLARKTAGDHCKKDHDRIEREIERLDELIGQVISLVRLESPGQELNKTTVALDKLLADVVSDAQFEAVSLNKNVLLEAHRAADIQADPELLHRALENVVRNALVYTAEGSVVNVRLQVEGGQQVITVRDQGPGVDESSLGSLFDAFYREADARDRQSGGYGLGLAIAQRAIELHGGQISARNLPEGGLEMEIRLPH